MRHFVGSGFSTFGFQIDREWITETVSNSGAPNSTDSRQRGAATIRTSGFAHLHALDLLMTMSGMTAAQQRFLVGSRNERGDSC